MKHAMKQLIALLLVLLLVVGITACSTASQGESNATNQSEGNTAEGSDNNATEEPTQNTVEANQTEDRGVQFPLENEVTLTMMVANVYGVDYEKKLIECTHSFIPSGDLEKEMREIKLYFKDYKGKHPELFSIGEV